MKLRPKADLVLNMIKNTQSDIIGMQNVIIDPYYPLRGLPRKVARSLGKFPKGQNI